MRAFLNDLAPWIPVLLFWALLAGMAVLGAAVLVEHFVVTIQQMLG